MSRLTVLFQVDRILRECRPLPTAMTLEVIRTGLNAAFAGPGVPPVRFRAAYINDQPGELTVVPEKPAGVDPEDADEWCARLQDYLDNRIRVVPWNEKFDIRLSFGMIL